MWDDKSSDLSFLEASRASKTSTIRKKTTYPTHQDLAPNSHLSVPQYQRRFLLHFHQCLVPCALCLNSGTTPEFYARTISVVKCTSRAGCLSSGNISSRISRA